MCKILKQIYNTLRFNYFPVEDFLDILLIVDKAAVGYYYAGSPSDLQRLVALMCCC